MTAGFITRIPLTAKLGPYAAHQKVYEAVPERPIYRRSLDQAYVVSKRPPAPTFDFKEYNPKIQNGELLRFALSADVSRSRSVEGERGERYDPVLAGRSEDRSIPYRDIAKAVGMAWLSRTGEANGFTSVDLHRSEYEQLRFVRPEDQRNLRFSVIHFEGLLQVSNAETFCDALLNGIGRGKAFGLGLLLVRRT